MKNKFIILAAAFTAIAALAGCDDAWNYAGDGTGEGKVTITTTVRSDVSVASRAAAGQDLGEKFEIWISSEGKIVRRYNSDNRMPESISLLSGHYSARAWVGDSVAASWSDKCFKGNLDFNVETGKTTPVELVCRIANVVASVKYDKSVADALSDYTLTVGHYYGTLTFEGNDTRKGYFMMNQYAPDLEWTLAGKLADGSEFTKKGVIKDARPATEYVLSVKHSSEPDEIGGGYFSVEIDATEVEIKDDITVAIAPQIKGMGFNISQPLQKEPGKVGRQSVFVAASSELKSVMLESEYLKNEFQFGGGDFDLMSMSDDVRANLEAKGINFVYSYDDSENVSSLKLNFEAEFTDALDNGEYLFSISATDVKGMHSDAVFTLVVNGEPVQTVEIDETDVWATKVALYGTLSQEGATDVMFNYRRLGEQQWTQAAPTSTVSRGTTYMIELSGLEPATAYEYTISCTTAEGQEFISGNVRSFTTASTPQLPNAGFEDWHKDDKIIYPFAEGGEMFWDSGNTGSSTMSKNVTQSSTDIKHGGMYSAKLESQFVGFGIVGKFAAGNIFIGEYLETLGTNGLLGWGRSFSGRPAALKGYVRYEPKEIDNVDKSAPAEYVKGDMDKGIIYVALLDDNMTAQTEEDYRAKYGMYPVHVNTKTVHLFNKEASNVIAYGEMVFTETTPGDGMVEFTVNLDYRRTDVIPSYIMCTASASKGGDYFTGGPSVMYIDDLELVY